MTDNPASGESMLVDDHLPPPPPSKHVSDAAVSRVLVSEGTRNMGRGKREVEQQLEALTQQKTRLGSQIMEAQSQLGQISRKLSRSIDDSQRLSLEKERDVLNGRRLSFVAQSNQVKAAIRSLNLDRNEFENDRGRTNQLLAEILIELRKLNKSKERP